MAVGGRRRTYHEEHVTARNDQPPRCPGSLGHRRVLASRQLLLGRSDLPAGQSTSRRTAAARAHQTPPARTLRHHARAESDLRPSQPGDQDAGPQHDLCDRPRTRWAGHRGQRLPRGHLQRGLSPYRPGRRGTCAGCSASSPSRVGSRATSHPRRPVRSTKAASSATPSFTPMAPPSTIRTSSWPASSATVRPRRDRWRRAGTRTSSSTPSGDGAVLPILHLNGYKIANPDGAGPDRRRRADPSPRRLRAPPHLRRRRRSLRRTPTTGRRPGRRLGRHRRDPAIGTS